MMELLWEAEACLLQQQFILPTVQWDSVVMEMRNKGTENLSDSLILFSCHGNASARRNLDERPDS